MKCELYNNSIKLDLSKIRQLVIDAGYVKGEETILYERFYKKNNRIEIPKKLCREYLGNGTIAAIDWQLYLKYGLDETEIAFIETNVRYMEIEQ